MPFFTFNQLSINKLDQCKNLGKINKKAGKNRKIPVQMLKNVKNERFFNVFVFRIDFMPIFEESIGQRI